jgi:hypothetical protein
MVVANLVDRADIGMVQGKGGLRFPLETDEGVRVSSNLIWQELQSHEAVQFYILSLVDDTHPTTAELLDDAVVRDGLADQFDNSSPRTAVLGWPDRQVNAGPALRVKMGSLKGVA